ncbi:ROK family protein [Virgibacillus dakarensis]|uniref:fructokinase n=1 Tax=Lentibacillus populi TaxID=1827502 RepID=A0A9W5TYU8_9BACI|nr:MULTISPECIES: ROK family protein [Bacillaceae]MBT2215568.1 ROK family protein [Virgibacillus dakarensis]MTW85203.1 ROK family protein [Virgibacillus dakarensis]GGB48739.1 fructokinase [Lentibacillus populi]
MLIGAIEAGGTKFVCAVGDESGDIIAKTSFPTKDPEETFKDVNNFFREYKVEAIGIGCFGPVDLDKKSDTYGTILNTPKTKWIQYDVLGKLKKDLKVPVYIDTDVNAAALAEYKYGAGRDVNSCMYITVGTGIGAGYVQDGNTYVGKSHPEMGHVLIQQHENDAFPGGCPYHGNCLEGLASGPAIEKRYGKKGHQLAADSHVWELEAYYLAQAIMNYFLILAPERIILGGGVMKQQQLYPLIRRKFLEMMNGYLTIENADTFIVAPELNDEQGVRGAMALVPVMLRN